MNAPPPFNFAGRMLLVTVAMVSFLALLLLLVPALAQDEGEALSKGIGPIESVELGPIDETLVAAGKETFELLCTACHKFEERYVGPPLHRVTERRSPEWIMNMILNPTQMAMEDPIAFDLLAEYMTPMADQSVTEEQARAILEYFRSIDAELPDETP